MSISVSSLFSSLSGSSSSTNYFDYSSLSDYNMIRNGTYYKLMKSYYAQESSTTSDSSSDSTTETNALNRMYTDATNLKSSAQTLLSSGSKSVFNKTTTTDEEGNSSYGYDTDKIYNAVKSFIDDYNSVIEEGDNVTTDNVTDPVVSMIKTTKVNSSLLSQLGITIGDDYQLSIDEETFKNADMSVTKSLFNGAGSYAYTISSYASTVANNALNATGNYTSYSSSGSSYVSSSSALGSVLDTST
ncbi:hypothetical protein [Eubacterium oxidoreducens]|nr:hypothetical protein [Eubacterium oxidoreducens]